MTDPLHCDVFCPYCNFPQDINHDDGYGMDEGSKHQQECPMRDKTFVYETAIYLNHTVSKANCLNGEAHTWRGTSSSEVNMMRDRGFREWDKCSTCDAVHRGPYTKIAENEN